MSLPFISCICPTYKRPNLLRNAIACFNEQNYPSDRCELIVLDDAAQFEPSTQGNVTVISINDRFANLPLKFNHLVSLTRGDVIAVWEDDDIFLPWHLKAVADCYQEGGSCGFYVSENVWSTYGQELGEVQLENAAGRFHSRWRFTRSLFDQVGGYPETGQLAFDQFFGSSLKAAGGSRFYGESSRPSYVYRWGNGYWHGSQKGDVGFSSLWDYVGSLPAEFQGLVDPKFDEETTKIINHLQLL